MGRINLSDQPSHEETDERQVEASQGGIEELCVVCVDGSVQCRKIGLRNRQEAGSNEPPIVLRYLEFLYSCFTLGLQLRILTPDVRSWHSQDKYRTHASPITARYLGPLQLFLDIRHVALSSGTIADRFAESKMLKSAQQEEQIGYEIRRRFVYSFRPFSA